MSKLVAFVILQVLTFFIIQNICAMSWKYGYAGYNDFVRGPRDIFKNNTATNTSITTTTTAATATATESTTPEVVTTKRTASTSTTSKPVTLCDPMHLVFGGFMFNHIICDHYCGTLRKYGRGSCRMGKCVC